MSPHAWIVLSITFAVFATLQWRRDVPADLLFLGALMAVTVLGVIPPDVALEGFANPAVITIASLFVVAAGLSYTGVLDWIGHRLLGTARTAPMALFRLSFTVLGVSAFVNNTPVVAMFVPVVRDWCRKRGVSPSRMLIPLSYFAILGGTCTLIGTSTNIITNGLLKEEQRIASREDRYTPVFREQLRGMTMFEIGRVGLPCAVIGAGYLLLLGRRLLPNRTDLIERLDEQRREYLVEMLVQPECRLIGQTVEQAGLRHLRGLFLVEIDREGEILAPVTPGDVIRAGDRLIFTGVVTTIVDLEKIPGLVPAGDMTYEIRPDERRRRHLSEAVLSSSSPLIGTTVRRANFRKHYGAAVVAVHRNGARLPSKIGDIVLQPGDTLLLQTGHEFAKHYRHNRDFYLVAAVEGSAPRRTDKALLSVGLLVLLVGWLSATSWLSAEGPLSGLGSTAVAALVVAGLMIVTRCLPTSEARSVVDLQVLVIIASALGLGQALTASGAAGAIAGVLVGCVEGTPADVRPYILLILLYVLSMIFTELITNTAVAAMLFPLGVATAAAIPDCSPRPFVIAIAVAASLSFITPVGYQTNLMVMGPGGYQFRDYMKVGWPLVVLLGVTAMVLIPVYWPFALPAPAP